MPNVLVIGDGGRESAICWKLQKSELVKIVYVSPGNAGTALMEDVENIMLDLQTFKGLAAWCFENDISLVFVGPETALADGIADYLGHYGILCFGPIKAAARLETDKKWAKEFMNKHGILTPKWKSFTNAIEAKEFIRSGDLKNPFVVKAAGLAGGKGVTVTSSVEEAIEAVDNIFSGKFKTAAKTVIIEERIYGKEASLFAFTDGKIIKTMPTCQDYKRLLNGDNGPNTGGMGVHGPVHFIHISFTSKDLLQLLLNSIKKDNIPFIGILYIGVMISNDSRLYTLEYNVRFGDPEAQIILPLLKSDLYKIARDCCQRKLISSDIVWSDRTYCVGVVLSSLGYPDTPENLGSPITGISELTDLSVDGSVIPFYGKIMLNNDGQIVVGGGRTMTIVGCGETLFDAKTYAYNGCSKINYDGIFYRTDIASKATAQQILSSNNGLTYLMAGVSVNGANQYISDMKLLIEGQFSSDVISEMNSFGSICDFSVYNYKCPYLVCSTDGVGTKLKIAQICGKHDGIGQDLVAMSVNDVLCQGAKPLYFLDYFASGKLLPSIMDQVLKGILDACHESGCTLVGGETAEMPGVYQSEDYDVAGFVIGIVEKDNVLPRKNEIVQNDVLIALPSSGIHSNGLSLVRKIIEESGYSYNDRAPFSTGQTTIGDEILIPTAIYVKSVLPLIQRSKIKAMAHITGGGLIRNLSRVLPDNVSAILDARTWRMPKIFPWLSALGKISGNEMLNAFNCGIGAVLIVDAKNANEVLRSTGGFVCGHIFSGASLQRVLIENFEDTMATLMERYLETMVAKQIGFSPRKRVAVFISGTGTNLKSLLEATKNLDTNAYIVVVVSNVARAKGLRIASDYGVPTEILEYVRFGTSDDCDVLNTLMRRYNVDLICLAGFMRLLGDNFVNAWRGKMINIHPSLLPAFKGLNAQKKALEMGVRITGCTVHFVEAEVDSGAIIEQETVRVLQHDTVDTLTERIKEKEHILFPKVLKLLAKGKIKLDANTSKVIRSE